LAIFPPEPVLGLKFADLDAQLNFVLNIHTLKADMSIAAEKLLLPSEDVRKKRYHAAAAMVFKKNVPNFTAASALVLGNQIHSVSGCFTCTR
jgi:hypothetical protein